jgi:hypothetical protein
MNTNDKCPICLESSECDDNIFIKIEHSKCRYDIHDKCLKLYTKCIYCKKELYKHKNKQLILNNNYSGLFIDKVLEYLTNNFFEINNNNFGLILFMLYSFIITYTIILPTIICLFLVKDYTFNKQILNIFQLVIMVTYWYIIYYSSIYIFGY